MSRSSPSVLRVVAVLDFFADHPGQAFTLTDLVRSLKLSRATCHGVLTALVQSGYLYRTSDKNYVLGPALLHVSEVTKAHFSPLQVAQPEMRELADKYDAICAAAFREGRDVVVRERAVAVSNLGYSTPRGTRLPLLPQLGAAFFTASSPSGLKSWIDGFDPPCSKEQIDALFNGLQFLRDHGYLFAVLHHGADLDSAPSHWLGESGYFDPPIALEFKLVATESYRVTSVMAPVYDPARKVVFVLALHGFHQTLSGREVERIGADVRDACSRITAFMAHPKDAEAKD